MQTLPVGFRVQLKCVCVSHRFFSFAFPNLTLFNLLGGQNLGELGAFRTKKTSMKIRPVDSHFTLAKIQSNQKQNVGK